MIPRLTRTAGVEMTHDHAFEARVRRLSVVSLLALGSLTWLAARDDAPLYVVILLGAGWLLMPAILRASLRRPRLRFALAVPAVLVASGLTAFCFRGLPHDDLVAAGWWTVTGSIWFGATMGTWLWFRWVPVPSPFDNPFGVPRLTLIALHIGGVLVGIGLILS